MEENITLNPVTSASSVEASVDGRIAHLSRGSGRYAMVDSSHDEVTQTTSPEAMI